MKKVSGTTEWASSNANCISGCVHDCWYCYAKAKAIELGVKTKDTWKVEDILPDPVKVGKRSGRVMFPTTHDITPNNSEYCLDYLEAILAKGNEILVVSKPYLSVIREASIRFLKYRDNILFRFTMGTTNSLDLKLWEPGAPDFSERISALAFAHSYGYKTSVSSEPMLTLDIDILIECTRPYITDCIWLGLMNKPVDRLTLNGATQHVIKAAETLLLGWSDDRVKELYLRYKNDRKVKWKESIKKIVGIEIPTEKGLDI
jgi:DNA repair photolyase